MENNKKPNHKGGIIQMLGGVLVISAGIIALLEITGVLKHENLFYQDGRRLIALIGFSLILIPLYANRINWKKY